jgi:hypothetical protein
MARARWTKKDFREVIELAAVFVLLGGLLGFLHGDGIGASVGATAGALLFAFILSLGALIGLES